MQKLIYLLLATFLFMGCNSTSQNEVEKEQYTLSVDSIRIRDPFIHYNKERDLYFMPAHNGKGFKMYESRDLKNWKDLGSVFDADSSFWGKGDFWAPDLYFYNNNYYIIYTCTDSSGMRGSGILIGDKPDGPFTPLMNEPITPKEWMTLDGALYIDEAGDPWLLYCHEWVQIGDGQVIAQRLSKDLKSVAGEPISLFKASEAPWNIEIHSEPSWNIAERWNKSGRVTDGCFPIEVDGKLYILWSSWVMRDKPNYTIGVAESETNKITGPWKQHKEPIIFEDGGHGMMFKDRDGQLMISHHAPNTGIERATIRPVTMENGIFVIKK